MIRRALRTGVTGLVLILSSFSVEATPSPADDAIEHARPRGALRLEGELFHVQGLTLDRAHVFVTSVDRDSRRGFLHEFDRSTGRFLRRIELTDGERYHPGGISISGRSIWVPVAELRPNSSAALVELDADTLKVRRRIMVADHLGCVAASGDTLVAGNWDSAQFYVIDLAGKAPTRVVPNPSATHFQDIKLVGNQLVAGGNTSWSDGTLDWIDLPTLTVTRSLRTGAVGAIRPFGNGGPYTGEGMAIEGRELYLVPEDGPSRLFHFTLDS